MSCKPNTTRTDVRALVCGQGEGVVTSRVRPATNRAGLWAVVRRDGCPVLACVCLPYENAIKFLAARRRQLARRRRRLSPGSRRFTRRRGSAHRVALYGGSRWWRAATTSDPLGQAAGRAACTHPIAPPRVRLGPMPTSRLEGDKVDLKSSEFPTFHRFTVKPTPLYHTARVD